MALELNLTKNTNTAIQGTAGKYYPRVEYKGMFTSKMLAKQLARQTSSFSEGEMLGILTDIARVLKDLVLMGYVVKIDDLGLFKASVEGNGLTLRQGAKVSAGVGRQRTDAELAESVGTQQFAIGAIKMIMQATGETTINEMTRDGQTAFTSKAKDIISRMTGNTASDVDGEGSDASDLLTSGVDAPTISGTSPFTDQTQVTISGPTGAIIYYTADGSEPTEESQRYTDALTLSESATIKAIAIKDGETSDIAQKQFTKQSSGSGDEGGGLYSGD